MQDLQSRFSSIAILVVVSSSIFLVASVHGLGPDFTISANPATLNFNTGSSGTSTITLNSTGGFNGNVNLNVTVSPSGLACSVIPSSVSVSSTSTATLVCTGSSIGSFTVIVTGTSFTISHSVVVTVNVEDFTIGANPATIITAINTQGTSTISATGLNGFSGSVSFIASTNPSGPSCTFTPNSVTLPPSPSTTTLSCTGSATGTFTVAVTGTSGSLSRTTSLTLKLTDFTITSSPVYVEVNSGDTASSTITLTSRNGYSGTISLSVSSAPTNLACSLSPASVTLSSSSATSGMSCSDTAGTFTVTVTATSGTLSHSTVLTVLVNDFTLSTTPGVNVNAGTNGTASVIIGAVNNFDGQVTLTTSISPTGLSCALSPSVVTVVQSASSSLSCIGAAGIYTVTITGTNGLLSHSTRVTYTVEDIVVVAATTGLSLGEGSSASTTIIVVSLDGYAGPVVLTTSVSPSSGLTCSLTPTSIILGTFGTSTLSCNGRSGTYNVNVTATSGILVHHASVAYSVQSSGVTGQPLSLSWFMIIAGLVGTGLASTVLLKRFNTTSTPFDNGFYKLAGGELHAPGTVLILGDPGTGTTTLGLELLQHELANGKYCGLITYDAFPSELVAKFRNIGVDISKHVQDGSLKMIDCYSALIGDENAPIKDAIDFTEISIQVTRMIEAAKGPITLLLDSVNPIINSTQPSTVVNFLRVLGAKVKSNGGLFIITGSRRSMTGDVTSKVEVVADAVLELGVMRKGNDMIRTLSFMKMAGHHYSTAPAEFRIISGRGIMFKKHRISLRTTHHDQNPPLPELRVPTTSKQFDSTGSPAEKSSGPEKPDIGNTESK